MSPLSYSDLAQAIARAKVRVGKLPLEHVNGETPVGALLDALNQIIAEKEGVARLRRSATP
jgi:hypothetical protein